MLSSSSSLPPSVSFSTPFTFDSESMFEHHPIRYLLQCARHNPAGTAASSSNAGITPSTASNPQTLALKLRIPATDTRTDTDGKKTYTVFHIQIIACCSSFSVVRRYSDFCDLHRDLTAEFSASNSSNNSGNNANPLSRLPILPPKKFLGSSLDSDFVSTRRAALETYLIKLFQDQTFLHSKSLSQFFVCVKEVPTVNVKVGALSNSSSRTQSLASESDIDVASISSRMSSLTAHILSLEQKLKWLEAASGMPLSLEHEVKSMASTIDSLKKKVGVLELTQPYLQQMNQTSSGLMNQSRTNSGNSGIVGPGVGSSMNGNAKPFQSQHRSVSGPVGSLIRYDFDHNEDSLDGALPHHLQQSHNTLDDDEADDDFGILPRRSISQRVASREKRAFLSTNHHLNTCGWPSSSNILSHTGNSNALGGVSAFSNDSTHSQGSPIDGNAEEESRGRSLSESHIDRDRLNAQLFGGNTHTSSHNQHLNRATSSSSSSSTGKHRTEGGNVSMRSVLDNTSRSLSNVDPWLSHRFQLRNRTESVTSVIGAQSQAPRLTTRQHSDPLAANPNAAGATHWYKQWVEDLGIEVQQAVAKDDAEAKFLQSLHKSATDSGSLNSTDRSKVDSLFAGSFPFLSKRGSGNASNSNSNLASTSNQENKNISSSTSSLFSVGLPLVLNPTASSSAASVSSSAANATSAAASTTLTSPVKSSTSGLPPTSPAIDVPTKTSSSAHRGSALLSTSPDLPQSPELGGSPNLGVSPELHQLANADKRSTLSPRAYGISPVNLSTIFPPPNLSKARSGSMDEDIDDKGTFTLNFEKEKVNATSSAKADSSKDQGLPTSTSSALTTSLASTLPLEDQLLELETQHPLFVSCMDASLNTRMNDLLVFISPSTSSESRYTAVLHYIENLIKRQIGAEVFCHGSFALKTYLPDADLDVSAFFSKVHEDTWVQKLVGALCQEAAIPTHGQQFAVKSVSFINAVVQVVKCNIGNINVDVSGNQTGALATLALFEEVDKLVGQNHLFKRTIILTKTWCQNEAGIVESGAGMLSSYCIRALVLFIFNAYHQHIKTPLQGLYFLLSYFGQFDFLEHAVGLFGPIQLSALPKFQVVTEGPCAWPADAVPLISQQLLSTYSLVATAPAVGSSHKHKARENDTLPRTYINVTDPCNPFNNLGRSVSQQNSATVRQAFKDGSKNMRKVLQEWMSTKETRRHNEEDLMRKSGSTTLSAEEQQSLDDMEAMESFKLVSKLFSKTLAVYGSFGGRGRFMAPVRGKRMIVRNGLLTLSEGSTSTSQAVSGTASPAAFHSSPAMRPAPTPATEVPSDAETVVLDAHVADENAKAASAPAPAPTIAVASAAVATSAAAPAVTTPSASTPLDANLSRILENLNQARQFETPDVSETELVTMIRRLLLQYGSVPVGKLGSLLHNVMGNHSLPSIMKERYGGLKRFLEKHPDSFLIASDHPFNPSTSLSPSALLLAQKEDEERNLQEQQAQMAQMAANGGNMSHGQHQQHHLSPPPHGGGGYHNNSSPHYGHSNNRQGGPHAGDRSHYTSPNDRRGGGGNHMGMRNMPYGNQNNSSHHMQQHYHNGPHQNQYNKQSNMNNRGTFGHQHQQPQQQQLQQHANLGQSNVNAYGHSNLMQHANPMNFQSHPTSPPLPMQTLPQPNITYQNTVPSVNLNNYVLNANARGPMQPMALSQQQQQMMPQSLPPHYGVVDNDYNDFPTLNSVLKQHR